LAELHVGADPDEAAIRGVTLDEVQRFLHMMGIFNGHGVFTADFVHWIRGCVTRLFDAGHEVRLTAAGTPITRQTIADRVAGALVVGLFHEDTRLNWKMQDYPACLMFSTANFMLAQNHFREYAQWLLPGTLLQIVMRVEFVSRATKFTLLEMLHSACWPVGTTAGNSRTGWRGGDVRCSDGRTISWCGRAVS
jgi:hypothetical protein